MIHYHGSPISGDNASKGKFYRGRHACLSFYYQTDVGVALDNCQSVILDSGAFSAWKKGETIDFDEYLEWVHKIGNHPAVDWALIPDVIDGKVEDNKAMVEEWDMKTKGVPVYHLHETLTYLEYLIDRFETIAFGSSGQWPNPGNDSWWKRMDAVMQVACNMSGEAKRKYHGLRMLSPEIFTRLPLSSADSTNASRHSELNRFGIYPPPLPAQRCCTVADRIEAENSSPIYTPSSQLELAV